MKLLLFEWNTCMYVERNEIWETHTYIERNMFTQYINTHTRLATFAKLSKYVVSMSTRGAVNLYLNKTQNNPSKCKVILLVVAKPSTKKR